MLWRVSFRRKPVREPGLRDYRFDAMTHLTMKDELLDAGALHHARSFGWLDPLLQPQRVTGGAA